MPEKRPRASRVAARGAPRSAPHQLRPAVVEDRHNAASHRQASRKDTCLGVEAWDPTEGRYQEEEEAKREEEADLPQGVLYRRLLGQVRLLFPFCLLLLPVTALRRVPGLYPQAGVLT